MKKIGASYLGNQRCEFNVWAPSVEECSVKLVDKNRHIPLQKDSLGYFSGTSDDIPPGTLYYYAFQEKEFPDPASNFQPCGVHGPSEVVDHSTYLWKYEPSSAEIRDLIIYELHIGTFTPEGTFRNAGKLQNLKQLGVTAIEIMPISQYPGTRNWGYDGVSPFSPQNSFGRPDDIKYLIDECPRYGLQAILDVVYNHFGPEGNYLRNFGPYFIDHYKTQNHDQVGNRAYGKRLTQLVSFEALKLAAGALILSPYVPGEEYGEMNPFLYFISHSDDDLVQAVREGRRNEFSSFGCRQDIPDPYDEDTFNRSKLNWGLVNEGRHKVLLEFYRTLINCRKSKPTLRNVDRENIEASGDEFTKVILLHRWSVPDNLFIILNFNKEAVTTPVHVPEGHWQKLIDSASEKWMGPGSPTPDELLGEEQNITIKDLSFTAYETKE